MSGGGCGGHVSHAIGAKIHRSYYATAAKSIEDELRERGIAPQVPLDGDNVMPQQNCNCAVHVVITIFVCAFIFAIVWELT